MTAQDGKKHGFGRYTWPDGTYYDGEWRHEKKHGRGKYTYPNGRGEYDGEWKDDKQHGKGVYTWTDGSMYTGESKQGEHDGGGTYTWPVQMQPSCLLAAFLHSPPIRAQNPVTSSIAFTG